MIPCSLLSQTLQYLSTGKLYHWENLVGNQVIYHLTSMLCWISSSSAMIQLVITQKVISTVIIHSIFGLWSSLLHVDVRYWLTYNLLFVHRNRWSPNHDNSPPGRPTCRKTHFSPSQVPTRQKVSPQTPGERSIPLPVCVLYTCQNDLTAGLPVKTAKPPLKQPKSFIYRLRNISVNPYIASTILSFPKILLGMNGKRFFWMMVTISDFLMFY